MKKYLMMGVALIFAATSFAQGNSKGKGKVKSHSNKENKVKVKKEKESEDGDWDGANNTGVGKASKNQPAKVRGAFQRDYPNARNVVWSKYRGDWTATFDNNFGRSTAVYHANGERRDTRTTIRRNQLPNPTIWDQIFLRDKVTPVGNVIQIESPSLGTQIFRIASQLVGSKLQYLFYNADGTKVQYNY